MPFELDNDFENIVQIKVIGVGGGGGNAELLFEGLHKVSQVKNGHAFNRGNDLIFGHNNFPPREICSDGFHQAAGFSRADACAW